MGTDSHDITDAELAAVFEGTNFGPRQPRQIVLETLLQIAGQYSTGHTAMMCCRELGLLGKDGRRLTKKGCRYMYHATKHELNKQGRWA